jgi:hypothetical protein
MLLRATLVFCLFISHGYSQVLNYLKSGYEIKNHYEFSLDEMIKGPEGLWRPILEIKSLDLNLNSHSICLFFLNLNSKTSQWQWTISKTNSCQNKQDQETLESFEDTKSLYIKINKNSIKLISETIDKKILKQEINLLNIENRKKNYSLFSDDRQENFYPGVLVLSQFNKVGKKEIIEPYPRDLKEVLKSKPCGGVNEKCEPIENQCEKKCITNFFIIPNGCPQGGPRYCGELNCGGEEMPACFRGHGEKNSILKKDLRLNQSSVYCQEPYKLEIIDSLAICR